MYCHASYSELLMHWQTIPVTLEKQKIIEKQTLKLIEVKLF